MSRTIITHSNIEPYLNRLQQEPEFMCGVTVRMTRPGQAGVWYRQIVVLEIPIGELCRDKWTMLALVGFRRAEDLETLPLDGTEGFDAQGLEGKVQIHKDLFMALMNLRDLIPEHRGRIILETET